MKNYYKILGVKDFATNEEVKHAYRVLARRYHPDVNPDKEKADHFKDISDAYSVLSNQNERRIYDLELEAFLAVDLQATLGGFKSRGRPTPKSGAEAYAKQRRSQSQKRSKKAQGNQAEAAKSAANTASPQFSLTKIKDWFNKFRPKPRDNRNTSDTSSVSMISILEVTLSIEEAIFGRKKLVQVAESNGPRNVSIEIPPGTRDGSVLRLKNKDVEGEDLVVITRVSFHPFLSLRPKGLVLEVPITVNEAISGATIKVPSLLGEESVSVPPGCQSGSEIRLRHKGLLDRAGERGDYFVRLLVHVPNTPEAVGLRDKTRELEAYYGGSVRKDFPKRLFDKES